MGKVERGPASTTTALFATDTGMTPRAKLYLAVAAGHHAVVGLSCLFAASYLQAPAFQFISGVLPFTVWTVGFLITAAICVYSLVFSSEVWARAGLVASAMITAAWAGGFMAALAHSHEHVAPTMAVAWAALALKDLIVCRQPLRSPFEPLVQRLSGDETVRDNT